MNNQSIAVKSADNTDFDTENIFGNDFLKKSKINFPEPIALLKQKIPLHVIKDFCRAHNTKAPTTWTNLLELYSDKLNILSNYLEELSCFGKKRGYLYTPQKPIDTKYYSAFERVPSTIEHTIKNPPDSYLLLNTFNYKNIICFSFCIKRERLSISNLLASDLSDTARGKYWQDNSTLQIKTPIKYCAFDSLIINTKTNSIAILIDDIHHSNETDQDQHLGEFLSFIAHSNSLRTELTPVELFPLINEMYSFSSEGIVSRLSFECITGAIRDEKIRNQTDLRKETYHENGKKAISQISPYRIEITYPTSKYSQLETQLIFEIVGSRPKLLKKKGVHQFSILSDTSLCGIDFLLSRLDLYTYENNE